MKARSHTHFRIRKRSAKTSAKRADVGSPSVSNILQLSNKLPYKKKCASRNLAEYRDVSRQFNMHYTTLLQLQLQKVVTGNPSFFFLFCLSRLLDVHLVRILDGLVHVIDLLFYDGQTRNAPDASGFGSVCRHVLIGPTQPAMSIAVVSYSAAGKRGKKKHSAAACCGRQ
ncbi:uncharacterized protein MEPE_00498 [Melanopsichium pennsylvanicum]|uniref:Uncharacterized protein n=1 Tax=Melanopsichium pennsylvanicum TaxID=63383 RepID=A0AAJ5C2Q8_9BASI|nr:uncharacterized protein MEPE_00498 [Melanopsichium pennsylvanicum]